jgi:putative transcriptional regulator
LRLSAGLVLAAAVLLPATLIEAARTEAVPAPPAPSSLTGQVLIAAPSMGDPRFRRTVILMVKHDPQGAFGLVINRPVGEVPIARLLNVPADKEPGLDAKVLVFAGGPVQPEQGFVLHGPAYRRAETLDVDGRFGLTSTAEVLRDIAAGKGPEKKLVTFGYAGWAPGQLEGELKREAWFTAPADSKLIFDDDRDKVWDNAMARRPRDI